MFDYSHDDIIGVNAVDLFSIKEHSEADFSHGICPECAEGFTRNYTKSCNLTKAPDSAWCANFNPFCSEHQVAD